MLHTPILPGARRDFPPDASRFETNTLFSKRLPLPDRAGASTLLEVTLATSAEERQQAQALVNRMYDWRGYGDSHVIPTSEGHSTFLASLDGELVGTITLGVDTGTGLAADLIFRNELNTFRRVPGASLCELVKFAFDADMPSRQLLASLFHIVFIYGMRHHRCSDLFIEVNPRHRRFYQTMLGFQPLGDLRTNSSVHAPSQLMWLKVADIAQHIGSQTTRAETNSRSLYPMFLSSHDERMVRARLARAVSTQGRPKMQTHELPPATIS